MNRINRINIDGIDMAVVYVYLDSVRDTLRLNSGRVQWVASVLPALNDLIQKISVADGSSEITLDSSDLLMIRLLAVRPVVNDVQSDTRLDFVRALVERVRDSEATVATG